MRRWKSILALLFSSGLIIAFGLTACGDDDDEKSRMTCEQALATLTSDTCTDAIESALPGIQTCLDECAPGDEQCVDDCLELADVLPSSCVLVIQLLMDDNVAICGACYVTCRNELVDCLVEGDPPGTCLVHLGVCLPTCN